MNHPLPESGLPDATLLARFAGILRGEADCPQCGAAAGEPCLTWRGQTFLDGTTHEGRRMKWRKKPVVVQAEQWFPGTYVPGVQVEPEHDVPSCSGGVALRMPARPYVLTIHRQRAYLEPGDWVITEPDGVHHYPCKPEVFAATYERVE